MPLQKKKNVQRTRADAKFGDNTDQQTSMGRLCNPASCKTNLYFPSQMEHFGAVHGAALAIWATV